jgi:hypothetical protein
MVAGLAYYPLGYWTLFGMETGLAFLLLLLAFGCSLKYRTALNSRWLNLCGLFCGAAYLARPDTVVLTAVLYAGNAVASWRVAPERLALVRSLMIFLAFPIAQSAFRFAYYGEWVPNTYLLKVQGIPLLIRLRNGWDYSVGFLRQSGIVLLAAVVWSVAETFTNHSAGVDSGLPFCIKSGQAAHLEH